MLAILLAFKNECPLLKSGCASPSPLQRSPVHSKAKIFASRATMMDVDYRTLYLVLVFPQDLCSQADLSVDIQNAFKASMQPRNLPPYPEFSVCVGNKGQEENMSDGELSFNASLSGAKNTGIIPNNSCVLRASTVSWQKELYVSYCDLQITGIIDLALLCRFRAFVSL